MTGGDASGFSLFGQTSSEEKNLSTESFSFNFNEMAKKSKEKEKVKEKEKHKSPTGGKKDQNNPLPSLLSFASTQSGGSKFFRQAESESSVRREEEESFEAFS